MLTKEWTRVHSLLIIYGERKYRGYMNNAVKTAFEIGDRVADKLGFYLVDAELVSENKSKILRLYIDRDGGVGIDECEIFSNAFSEEYDKIDPIKDAYCLEISSPGVDRTLKSEREFNYYSGREVDVKLYGAIDGLKEFTGELSGFDGERVTVMTDDQKLSFKPSEAIYVKLAFRI